MIERDPLVSVVIPAYNRSQTIGAALESVQEQTYQNWEVIAVDDGSNDSTAQLVEEYARSDGRIRLIAQDFNRGAQAARNAGIRAARGEWIAFLDSDDRYLPESLSMRLALAARKEVSVVHSECYIAEADGQQKLYGVPAMEGNVYRDLLACQGPMFQGFLVARPALDRIGLLDEKIVSFQEWDTALRLAKHYRFGFEPSPTFIYDCRASQTISKDKVRGGVGYEQIVSKHFFAILRHRGPRTLANHYRVAREWYEAGKDWRAARRCVWVARALSALDPLTVLRRAQRISVVQSLLGRR